MPDIVEPTLASANPGSSTMALIGNGEHTASRRPCSTPLKATFPIPTCADVYVRRVSHAGFEPFKRKYRHNRHNAAMGHDLPVSATLAPDMKPSLTPVKWLKAKRLSPDGYFHSHARPTVGATAQGVLLADVRQHLHIRAIALAGGARRPGSIATRRHLQDAA